MKFAKGGVLNGKLTHKVLGQQRLVRVWFIKLFALV